MSWVEFDVGAGYTYPDRSSSSCPRSSSIDPAWAPLVVAAGLVLGRTRDIVRDHNPGRQVLVVVSNAWFAIGPALVLTAFGVSGPAWDEWPIYVLALASQFVVDTGVGAARERLVLGVQPRLQLRMTGLVFLVDVLLTPIGFLAAVVAQDGELAFLLVLPLAALLRVFARERAARIDQAIELSAAYRGTAFLLGEVIVADDEYTGEHSYGVIALSLEIADEMGLSEDDRRLVEFGALLHDVGKIAVPKSIVNKPGPLDDDEWKIMRQHTVAGQRMLDKVGGSMTDVGAIVRASHERWDGERLSRTGPPARRSRCRRASCPSPTRSTRSPRRGPTGARRRPRPRSRSCSPAPARSSIRRSWTRSCGSSPGRAPRARPSSSRAPPHRSRRACGSCRTSPTSPSRRPTADKALDKALEEQLKNLF